jgi:hypothetical protein
MGEKKNASMVLVGMQKGKRPLGRHRCGWGIILSWISDKIGWYRLDWPGSGQTPMKGSCEHCNEPLGSIKCWEILE